jgi:hypothetical protein
MRTLSKIARPGFLISTITFASLANTALAQQAATASPKNLVGGAFGPLFTSPKWAGYSALNLIPGASVFPLTVSSPTTVLYIGFTAGTVADINHMVLYSTRRQSAIITAVTPVTLKGISDPSILLTDHEVCPNQPISNANPCIVRLDPMALTLSALNDYYFVLYFTDNSLNLVLGAAVPVYRNGSLNATYLAADESQLKVGQSVPYGTSYGRSSYFLIYVMNN